MFSTAASTVADSLQRGAAVDDIASSFEDLSAKAGASSEVLLNQLNVALDGTVSKFDLMKQSNELLLGGIAPDKFQLLAGAARSLGEATGVSAKQGMEQLSDSLLKGNDRALKTLGIVVDNNKALADFAKSVGTTADKLNEEGKVLAIRNASLKALEEQQGRLTKVTRDAGDRIDQFNTVLGNLRDDLLRDISKDEGINKALDDLVTAVKNIDFTQFKSDLIAVTTELISFTKDGILFAVEALHTLSTTIEGLKGNDIATNMGFDSIFRGDLVDVQKELTKITDLLSKDLPQATEVAKIKFLALKDAISKGLITTGTLDKNFEQLLNVSKQLKAVGVDTTLLTGAARESSAAINQQTGAFNGLVGPINKVNTALAGTKKNYVDAGKAAEDAKKKIDDIRKATTDFEESVRKLLGQQALPAANKELQELATSFVEGTIGADKAKEKLDKLLDTFGKSPEQIKKLQSAAEEAFSAARKEAEDFEKQLDELADSDWAGDFLKNIPDGGIFGNTFDGLFGSSEEGISASRDLGEQLAADLASGLKTGLDIALNGASGKETRAALSSFFTDIGATFADSALPGSGQFVQAFGGVFEAGIEHIFGGESAGLTARKAADKFFADAFDANRLGVIIDGQLQIIEDLVFKGDTLFGGNTDFTDNSFSQFFESLPDQARQAFQGVGAGFEELLGVGEDIGGQLAAVFANNVGGSLNNLQLLVQASGVSFEDLSKNVVNAFNNGKLSALEAQVALQGIAQVSQDGIPDGIGFTIQAFENLKAAGVKGGRALTDALKDIGFEAKEVGIRDFGALQANLVASGKFTQQEIEQLFKALADNGITSIEQLTSATDQQLIPILAQLEAQKFPFAEAAHDAGELITQINDLPDEKTFTLKVRTEFDARTEQISNTVGFGSLIRSSGPGNSIP